MDRTAALLFSDVVDSTLTTQRLGDERASALWAQHDRRARTILARHGGREIGRSDGLVTLFDDAADAVGFALDYHAAAAELGVAARAGLHVGPVLLRHPTDEEVALGARPVEVDGLALSLAARVMAMARGGQTLVTAAASAALDGEALDAGVEVRFHGHYRLKGIAEPVGVHEVGVVPACPFAPPADAPKSYRVVRIGDSWQPVREIPHRLPAERDAFVGRAADLAAIAAALDDGTRLLTLLGPGGTGKTRLAIHYGRSWLGDWPGGVWFCDLSDAATLDGMHYAVATTLGVRLAAGDEGAQITEAIAARGRCLVVIDNFEQVVGHASATLGRWMDAPQAAFVVTSRERLNLPGERVQLVEPLPLDTSAIDLFVVRARAVRSDFAADDRTRAVLADIVTMLDGLPLAIELAAARVSLLSPAQLLERLRDRFALLGGRQGPGRQATLRAAIDWSWHLLSPAERSAVEQCAAFEGGFTLAAAEDVFAFADAAQGPPVIDIVQALVDKSLLRRWLPDAAPTRHELDEPYFRMYLSIHEYAAEKCRERGREFHRALHERHGRYFATFGSDDALDALATDAGMRRLHALRRELDNLVAACRRAAERGDGDTAVGCYRAAWEVLALQGPFGIALALGEAVLAIPQLDVRLAELARLTHAEALTRIGATEGLEASLAQALERVRGTGDIKLEARILGRLGNLCLWSGRVEQAQAHYADALDHARQGRHRLLEARMHGNLAIACHERGRLDEAQANYEAALAIERAIGSRRDEAITLCNYADLLRGLGFPDRARATFTAALSLLAELGDSDTEAVTLQQLGEFELDEGLVDAATETLHKALVITSRLGNRRVQAYVLHTLGQALLERGDHDGAQEALAHALAITSNAPNRRIEAMIEATRGDLAFRQGRLDEAAARLSDAEARLREQDELFLLADVLAARGHVDLARGNAEAARHALDEAERIVATIHAGASSGAARRVQQLRSVIGR